MNTKHGDRSRDRHPTTRPLESENPLDTASAPIPRWLSVEQIRKLQRCRRERVIEAMESGNLPFERRGRIRYARLSDVIAWEEARLRTDYTPVRGLIHPDLADFA